MENFNRLKDAVIELFCFTKNKSGDEKISKEDLNYSNVYLMIENLKSTIEILTNQIAKLHKVESPEYYNFEDYEEIIKNLESKIRYQIKVKYN
jgi:hypothetical protein